MNQLGRYRIETKLGEGAMGFVYKAWHPGFNDYVALKTIQDTRLEGRELLDRFKFEGQALAKLKHQNIVQIYDADQADGVHFIVMEYMNGGSLDRIITNRDNIPLARRVGYLVPVCHALDYAHKRRLFHRDIKPANIMLHIDGSDEIVKVVDFGIARLVDSSHTQTKVRIGSPYYMAPELITAIAKANERTDIWALGVTLYELISYQRPFNGNDPEDLARNIVRGLHKPLTQIVPDCPKDLSSVVEKTLQKDPGSRYQTVEDLLVELEPIAKRLRTDVAGSLVRRAKDLLDMGEFESAKSALDEARKYDTTNPQARSLLQKVEEELRRKELLPRLQEDLRLGRNFLGLGQYREARAAAEHAIGLDSRFEPAHKLLTEIQEAEALAEEIQQKLSYAKRCVSEDELTEASRTVDEVLSLDAGNRQAIDLSAKIRSRREELERRKKLNQSLRSADDLLIVGKYDECLSLLEQALREFPENVELQNRRRSALSEKSEQLRQSLLNQAKKLRTSQQFDQALEILDELLLKFPGDSAGTLLRSSIQKERDQEHLNKQLGLAWDQLRSLKHQGKFSQALILAKGVVAKFPSERRIKEFVQEMEAEIRQDQIHAQLDARVNEIQELIRDGRFSQAALAVEDTLKLFPNNPLLHSLREECKTQQNRKDILERQNKCLFNVRRLISAGQFNAASELARTGLAELGEHPELRKALGDAERHYRAEVERNRQREVIAIKVQESCEKRDIGSATRILQNAMNEGVIEKGTPLQITLNQHIEGARDKEQKDREVEIELKRREVRKAVDQKEFDAAIRLADELERDFGLDREASDLRRIAQSSIETERIARQERDEVLQRAANYLNLGNHAAADQILRNSMEAGILKTLDPQVAALLAKTKELLDRDKERKKRVQQIVGELRELLRKGNFAEAVESGRRAFVSEGHHDEIAELVRLAKIALAKEESLQKRRLAELGSIRGLLEEGDAHQAKTLMEDALQQGLLDRKDREVVELQRQVAERIRRLAPSTETETVEPPGPPVPRRKSAGKWMFGGVAAGVLAILATGGYSHYHRVKKLTKEDKSSAVTVGAETRSVVSGTDAGGHLAGEKIKESNPAERGSTGPAPGSDKPTALNNSTESRGKSGDSETIKARGNAVTPGKKEREPNPPVEATSPRPEVLSSLAEYINQRQFQRARAELPKLNAWPASLREWRSRVERGERDRVGQLRSEIGTAANAGDSTTLRNIQNELQPIAGAGGPASDDARDLISTTNDILKLIEKRNAYEREWKQAVNDFNRNNKDAKTLQETVMPEFQAIAAGGGPHAQDAKDYTDTIEKLSNATPPQPPGVQTSQKSPCESEDRSRDCNAIRDLVEKQLSNAFGQRSLQELQALWPALTGLKDSRQKLKATFDGASQFSRRFTITRWQFIGPNEVSVSGDYNGESISRDGQRSPRKGHFDIRVVQENGRWVIKDLIL